MTTNEALLFALLALFGGAAGIASGRFAAKKRRSMSLAAVGALLSAILLSLALGFVFGFAGAWQPDGFSLSRAISAGLGGVFYFGFGISLVTAIGSVASAYASYVFFAQHAPEAKKEPIQPPETTRGK